MKLLKWTLITIGILNLLEAINVFVNENAATTFGYTIDYISHGIFHIVIGFFFIAICSSRLPFGPKTLKVVPATIAVLLIVNGIGVLILQQNAIKFGYSISYLLHATYYIAIGTFILMVTIRSTKETRAAKAT